MDFIKKPNLPDKQVKYVITDYRISKDSLITLEKLGIKAILSCSVTTLYDAVAGHPDMIIHHLGGNKFITAPETNEHFSRLLPDADVIKGIKSLNGKYPDDIVYNSAALGNFVFCRADYTAPEILSSYKNILNVKQGYAKCSICIVSENSIITSDENIYRTSVMHGIDALRIREGYIHLNGLPYGFIGGSTGLISKNLLAVNGNIKTHPDCDLMQDFCKQYGVDIISLNKGEIEDVGSIIPIA